VYAAGATRGGAQKDITRYLSDLFGSRTLITEIQKTLPAKARAAKKRKS